MKWWTAFERAMESVLWWSRFVMLVPVIGSALLAFAAIYFGTAEVVRTLADAATYAGAVLGGNKTISPSKLVAGIIKAFDAYLVAAILLIFAFGLYELFVSKISPAEETEHGSRLLLIRNLDDLKNRLGKTILIILVIEVLQQALQRTYSTPLDVLILGGLVLLVGAALWLSNLGGR
jgi:uncharacterized membrane protein YqhA